MPYAEHFSIDNIPYGVASGGSHPKPAPVTRLEDNVFFLSDLNLEVSEDIQATFLSPTLNDLAALSKIELIELRGSLQDALSDSSVVSKHGIPIEKVQMHLPIKVGGFTDFSCSREHLLNAGEAAFGERVMPPSALHYPIAYNGRGSTVVVSGTPIRRPWGQIRAGANIDFAPSRSMDYELEMGAIIGKSSQMGQPIKIGDADEHIFGLVILNDWSARDIQTFEMKPLGPMSSKTFGTTISPWVVTLEALEPFACAEPEREFETKAYLKDPQADKSTYDVELKAELIRGKQTTKLCTAQLKWMYWTMRHLVTQCTVNGCNVSTGDILATGTISGVRDDEHACLLELSKGGKATWPLSDGQNATWLEDGDEVRLTAYAGKGVGFGECSGVLKPAISM